MRVTRTYLAVPAHREAMVRKAASGDADAVFLDLEDAVPPECKEAALVGALAALDGLDWGTKTVCVRTNAPGTGWQQRELRQLGRCRRLDTVLLPKVESAEHILDAAHILAEAAREAERRPLGIEALVETARGMVAVDQVAAAGGGLEALHFGIGDFAARQQRPSWPPAFRCPMD